MRQDLEWGTQRLVSVLFGCFAGIALVLALAGIYSVVAYSVAQRTNEFGIRMALGAKKSDVLWMVVNAMNASVLSGLAIGLGISLAINRATIRWTENSSHNPMLLLVASVLLLCAGVACLVPARRAATVDPMKALRYE